MVDGSAKSTERAGRPRTRGVGGLGRASIAGDTPAVGVKGGWAGPAAGAAADPVDPNALKASRSSIPFRMIIAWS